MKTRWLPLLACVLALSACGSLDYTDAPPTLGVLYSKYAYTAYQGDIRPMSEVGIVTTDGLVQIETIDGKPLSAFRSFKTRGLYPGGRFQLHLLPGSHRLSLSFHDDRGNGTVSWSISNLDKTIDVKPGEILHLSLLSSRSTWNVRMTDGSAARQVIASDFAALQARH